jgi:hypothetical protein
VTDNFTGTEMLQRVRKAIEAATAGEPPPDPKLGRNVGWRFTELETGVGELIELVYLLTNRVSALEALVEKPAG